MLTLDDIKGRALEKAQQRLGEEARDVVVENATDHEGRPSLRVTIILKSKWSIDPPGNSLNEITRYLASYLSEHGDERFPFTHYMTAREFSNSNDKPGSTSKRRNVAG